MRGLQGPTISQSLQCPLPWSRAKWSGGLGGAAGATTCSLVSFHHLLLPPSHYTQLKESKHDKTVESRWIFTLYKPWQTQAFKTFNQSKVFGVYLVCLGSWSYCAYIKPSKKEERSRKIKRKKKGIKFSNYEAVFTIV